LRGEWKATGDPTEIALQVFATKLGLGKPTLASDSPEEAEPSDKDEDEDEGGVSVGGRIVEKVRFDEDASLKLPKRFRLVVEFPFSSEVKRMSTIYLDRENDKKAVGLIKGAVRVYYHCFLRYIYVLHRWKGFWMLQLCMYPRLPQNTTHSHSRILHVKLSSLRQRNSHLRVFVLSQLRSDSLTSTSQRT
jgi:magnesium-transporting ATPase (P-type)